VPDVIAAGGREPVVIPYTPRPEQRRMHDMMDMSRFCVFVAHRRMGKTVAVVNHLVKAALSPPREGRPAHDRRYAYIGPLLNQTKDIAWAYLKRYTAPVPGVKANETELWVQLPGGHRIRIYGADRPDALRGLYLDGVVLDEVAQMKPEVWGEIVRPALADRRGFAVFIGTPKGPNLFHELYRRAENRRNWSRGLWRASETTALPPSELEDVRRELSENQYRQEFLCDFQAVADDVLIPLAMADEAARRVVPERELLWAEKAIGVDVARFGEDSSAICRRQGRVCHPLQVFRGIPTDALAERVAFAVREFAPDAVNVDGGGPGPGVIDLLRRWGYAVNDIQFGSRPLEPGRWHNKRAEMWGLVREWLRTGGALPAEDAELRADLCAPRFGFGADGHLLKLESKDRIKERGGRSPDRGDALALTFAVPVAPRRPEPAGASRGHIGLWD